MVDALSVPVIANGDVFSYQDFSKYRETTGCAGVMTARGAQWNCRYAKYNETRLSLETTSYTT